MNCNELLTDAPLYLSGELDAARLAEMQSHLETCPACAAEMTRQRGVDTRIREAVLAEATDSGALDSRIRKSIAFRRWRPVAVGIAAALVVAFAGSMVWNSIRVTRVYSDAARDHHREVVDRQPRAWISDPSTLEALAAHQGLLPSTLTKLARAGYTMERGKLCRLDGRVYLHMVYARNGQDFSVFLRQSGEPFSDKLRDSDQGQDHLASFQTDLVAGMVVTDQSSEAARQLAHVAAAIL